MSFTVDYNTLSSSDASNKFISLTGVPLDATQVAMDLIGGTAQAWNGDFIVDGTKVRWDGYALDGTLSTGDKIRTIYDRS